MTKASPKRTCAEFKVNFQSVVERLAIDCDLDSYTTEYVCSRLRAEGLTFLRSILPIFEKLVLLGIELGNLFEAYAILESQGTPVTHFQRGPDGFPKVFRFALKRIFSRAGNFKEDSSDAATYLFSIRQTCLLLSKLVTEFTAEQLETAQAKFLETEESLSTLNLDLEFINQIRADIYAHYPYLSRATCDFMFHECPPRNGPGTYSTSYLRCTAAYGTDESIVLKHDGLTYLRKVFRGSSQFPFFTRKGGVHILDPGRSGFHKPRPSSKLHMLKPLRDITAYGPSYVLRQGRVRLRGRGSSSSRIYLRNGVTKEIRISNIALPVSEVLHVPKDYRGPRTIVREPYDILQYQMAYFDFMSRHLERLTYGRINFRDQSKNRSLAKCASLNRENATLDLKDASDRVSYRLCRLLFFHMPLFEEMMNKYRTHYCVLQGSDQPIKLNKLAGMGSGLTFATMAFIIHLVCTRAIINYLSSRHEKTQYRRIANQVYVYGDDIIVPSRYTLVCAEALSKVGLAVNLQKSFSRGFFRESCGGDYLMGTEVTPVRLRLRDCCNKPVGHRLKVSGPNSLFGLERFTRELVKKQLTETAAYFYSLLEGTLKYKLPEVDEQCPAMGRLVTSKQDVRTVIYDSTGTSLTSRVIVPYSHKGSFGGGHECEEKFFSRILKKEDQKDDLCNGFDFSSGTGVPTLQVEPVMPKNDFGIFDKAFAKLYKWITVPRTDLISSLI